MPRPLIPVCAGVILKSGMILLARRAPGRKHEGKWEFPGGRVEDGETPAAALARELKEELGIEAQVGAEAARTRHAYDFGEIELIAHLVPRFSGEITLKDHDKIAWVEARKLLEYDLAPADVPIAEAVAAHRRRGRYKGTHPTEFSDKYKELAADPDAVAKAKARGSTPAGMHVAIMVAEVLEALSPPAGAVVLDCTLGFGGHAEALARRGARVVALDRDAEELARTAARLASLGLPIETVHSDYARAEDVLAGRAVDGVLADLGVSSMQLDRPERGMSFKRDGPLDMRMDRTSGETAAAWIARVAESELSRALSLYGDEPDAAKIAASLKTRPPRTTFEPNWSSRRRSRRTSSLLRTNESATKSRPASTPARTSRSSFSVSDGKLTSTPGRLMCRREPSLPGVMTRQRTWVGSISTTFSRMRPLSTRIVAPTFTSVGSPA